MDELTARQQEVLDCITASLQERGYPPSVREIGESVGLASPSSVHAQLSTLQRLGYIRRDPTKPRAIEVRQHGENDFGGERRPMTYVPHVGEIAAGRPLLAAESIDELFPVPTDWVGDGTVFMLTVRGDSMIDVGILDGDHVIVEQQASVADGEIVAALIEGESATVKRLVRRDGKVVLIPENETMSEMVFDDGVEILGRVVAVFRTL